MVVEYSEKGAGDADNFVAAAEVVGLGLFLLLENSFSSDSIFSSAKVVAVGEGCLPAGSSKRGG